MLKTVKKCALLWVAPALSITISMAAVGGIRWMISGESEPLWALKALLAGATGATLFCLFPISKVGR